MSSLSQRFTKASGVLLVLATAALAGCAVTTGQGALPPGGTAYVVCSGGHASRFPEREEIGRICRPSASLQAIY